MADLLPSLSSDDENVAMNSDDDEDSMCMDESFTLVGGSNAQESSIPRIHVGWSFQTALNSVHQPQVPRMDIDAIISAKRKELLKSGKEMNSPQEENQEEKHDVDSQDSDNSNDGQSSTSATSDSDEDEDDTAIEEDTHLAAMEGDILKTKTGSKKQKTTKDDPLVGTNVDEPTQDPKADDDESGDSEDDNEYDCLNEEEQTEGIKASAFFDTKTSMEASFKGGQDLTTVQVFNQLPLCRPLLRGIASMGFVQPTPIQIAVIPLALNGRDICASAVTGSGKTAAFVLPIAERIIHRTSHNAHCTRAIILTPTRELAAQCLGMLSTLTSFTKLRASLVVGGTKNVSAQAAELRTRPDFIIATPGRLLDHITNSVGFSLEDVEFLILDEADRLLDLGFSDEIMEIVKACPVVRQTLLFSATMNTKVDDLIRLSLKNPVRVRISDQNQHNFNTNGSTVGSSNSIEVAPRLEQEFVRIRASNEGVNREGALLALLTRTYKTQVICFFDTKAIAHRMMILAGLCGIRCAELHGNLTQPQRLQALEDFRCGNVDVLLATDLAARGLDIDRVQAVINFEMPSQLSTYVHRIGRTARAGRGGRSCTLIGEGRRHLMKELLKESHHKTKGSADPIGSFSTNETTGVIRTRAIPAAVIAHFAAKIQSLEPHYEEVLQAETVARMDRLAEMEVTRAQNLIEHADEIKQRPQKEWFASSADKQRAAAKATTASKETERPSVSDLEKATSGMHRMTRKKRRAREGREAMEQSRNKETEENQQPSKINLNNIKSDVRKQKRLQAELRHGKSDISVYDLDVEEQRKQKKKNASGLSSNDAVGDSALFGDEKVSFSSNKGPANQRTQEASVAKSSYKFVGYNPDKKLGKKKSHKAFKSKSKHRRR
jgi:ATP-dependent RNA helicase DDX27